MTHDKTAGESAYLSALTDLCTPWCIHVVATLRIADHIAAGIEKFFLPICGRLSL
jgi:hypothetical protein